ncbi:hypothetical protein AVM11_08795 [Sphingomonas melonis TY]|uniref:Uncharacterized protein n=1 Tax=Sphingomonas melonis TY TaxID=621456 RepID=A0A175Y023_9SPHN|nr:hypothetical protein [Sphingomonas melonis]AOW22234.1 hypothetical protein BJP26_00585 [Sphingomonas melonis TY]KZB94092.1 hypothetical protein AVM11_08795 [Sphingomonas melonis TY]
MPDLLWPADLMPYKVAFYLQAHVGGSESPLTRVRKTYGLSAPRWVARLSFRGGYDGMPVFGDPEGFGPRLDAIIADLRGGEVKAVFHDFRRPRPLRPRSVVQAVTLDAAAKGATFVVLRGLAAGSVAASIGDYLGGDGRPHLVSIAATIAAGGVVTGAGSVMTLADGTAKVGINPPLSAPIAAGTPLPPLAAGRFQLTSDDAGQNETEVGQPTEYVLDFVEDLE